MSSFNTIRDQITEQAENGAFLVSDGVPNYTSSNAHQYPFYVDKAGHLNFGYGIDIKEIGRTLFLTLFTDSGISPADLTLLTNEYDDFVAGQITLSQLNSSITQQDWRPVAQGVMDNYFSSQVDPALTSSLSRYGFSILSLSNLVNNSPNIWAALEDLQYNAPSAIYKASTGTSGLPGLAAALEQAAATGNWGNVALAIDSNIGTDVASRRQYESMMVLGFDPFTSLPLTPTSVNTASLITYEQGAAEASLVGLGPSGYATTQPTYVNYLAAQGYYVPQYTSETFDTIAAQNLNGITITGDQLLAINNALPTSNMLAGGLVFVPSASASVGTEGITASSILTSDPSNPNSAFVFDVGTNSVYAVGDSINGGNASALYIDEPTSGTTDYPVFAKGNYGSISYSSFTNTVSVAVQDPDGNVLGTFALNTATGADSFTLTNGYVIPSSLIISFPIAAPANTNTSATKVLIGDLEDMGYSTTMSALSALNFTYYNPAATDGDTFDITGTPTANPDNESATVNFTIASDPDRAPGAVITGLSTAPITVDGEEIMVPVTSDILTISGAADLSQDTITGIDTLNVAGDLALTQEEWNSFTTVNASDGLSRGFG